MKPSVLVLDMSGACHEEGLPQYLEESGVGFELLSLSSLEGTSCYCDPDSEQRILDSLPEGELPLLRWIDTGDYHYLSCLLAARETRPFHLLLADHHPDDQEPALGSVLSCGGWVAELRRRCPLLQDIVSVGPESEELPLEWLESHKGKRLYLSLDKDVMDGRWAKTDWSQGSMSQEEVKRLIGLAGEYCELVAIDICGGITLAKGASADDLALNLQTDRELIETIYGRH